MNVIVVKDYEEMSRKAAEILLDVVKNNESPVLGLATGSSPIGIYREMVKDHEENGTDYSKVITYNLDEYAGLPITHKESYYAFMHRHLFDPVGIREENTHLPNGLAKDLEAGCKEYEEMLKNVTVDVQLLGIGGNGHIGFNEPGTPFESETHVVKLTAKTIADNSRFFVPLGEETPAQAVSMGLASIMRSKKIVLVASGENKADAVCRMVNDPVNADCPATILRNHPDVTVIVDAEAGKRIASRL